MAKEFTSFLDTFAPVENTNNETLNAFLDTLIEGPAPAPTLTTAQVNRLVEGMLTPTKKVEAPKADKAKKRKTVRHTLFMPKQPRMETIDKPKRKTKKAEEGPVKTEEPMKTKEPMKPEEPVKLEEISAEPMKMEIVDTKKPIAFDITDNCNGLPHNVVVNIYMCDRH